MHVRYLPGPLKLGCRFDEVRLYRYAQIIYYMLNCIDEFDEFEKMISHGRAKQGDLADDRLNRRIWEN